MKKFASSWISSAQVRKQRKYRYNAPLHTRGKFLSVNLSEELRKKHSKRNMTVRKGDTIKVMRGSFKGKTGKVERVFLHRMLVLVVGIENVRKDGTKNLCALKPGSLQITELLLDDKKRMRK